MTSVIRVCTDCGKAKCMDQYEKKGDAHRYQCKKCRYQAKVKRKLKAVIEPELPVVEVPKARHPWELLGVENRPNWSKV